MIYRLLFKLILQRIPPETAHRMAAWLMHAIGTIPGVRDLLRRLLAPSDACLEISALGLTFPSPVGAAAGLDKNLTWFEDLGSLGFGFVEVGTVTALRQRGNPRPRVRRLVADRALINSMGFPNDGAAAAAQRLRRRSGRTIIAVNVGKSMLSTDVADDYRRTVRELAPMADFVVLNVSSPNTAGLRDIQDVDALTELIAEVRMEFDDLNLRIPLLIKISPDLADPEVDALADLALRLHLDGIVAVNTTTSRQGLQSAADIDNPRGGLSGAPLKIRARQIIRRLFGRTRVVDEPGGLSGPPLKGRALEVLRRLSARTRGEIVLVSVGGVETADDAWERILAGASLVQAHTGFVYGGPLWPYRVNRRLAARARARGIASIQDVIGADDSSQSSNGNGNVAGGGTRPIAVTSRPH